MDGSGELNLLWKNAKILVALKGSINGTQHIHTHPCSFRKGAKNVKALALEILHHQT